MEKKEECVAEATRFIDNLYVANQSIMKSVPILKNLGEIVLLKQLSDTKDGLSSGEIAKRLSMKTARVAAILRVLEKKGYINRVQDKDDKRIIKVFITPSGEEEFASITQKSIAYVTCLYDHLGMEEMENFISSLMKIANLGKDECLC